jgi:hypothetical protein
MYAPQTLKNASLDAISGDNIVRIEAERLYDPNVNGPGNKKVRFSSKGEPPRTTVCFGPYISLPAGSYLVQLHGTISGAFEVFFTRSVGKHVIANQVIAAMTDAMVLQLPEAVEAFEVVVRTTRDSIAFTLDGVDLIRVNSDKFSATNLLPPSLHELRLLQTQPAAINPGVSKGRNIRAGYLRGTYIASGEAEAIAHDPDWIAAQEAAEDLSIVPRNCLFNLFLLLKYSNINGNIIEFGAFRGGVSLMMATLLKNLGSTRKVYALDTFEGMPESCNPVLDMHTPGVFSDTNYEALVAIRDRRGLDNLVILKGLFQDTVGQIPENERKFFLAHVDCDIYESVKFSIDYTAKHAVDGAYLVFDDPLIYDCLGAFQAVEEELIQKRGLFAEQAYPHLVYRYPALS